MKTTNQIQSREIQSPTIILKPHYGVISITRRGERVKSIVEKKIADILDRYGIEYQYEKTLVIGQGNLKHLIHPDFYLPKFDLYIEYWGLVGADRDYEHARRVKMRLYDSNNIKFISIYSYNQDNLEWILLKRIEDAMGKGVLEKKNKS